MTARVKYLGIGTIIVIVSATAWGLRSDAVPVDTVTVTRGLLRITVDDEGMTRVRTHEDVNAPVAGRFTPVGVRIGDRVSRGDIIGNIGPATLDAEGTAAARARISAAEAALRGAQALHAAADSTATEAQHLLERREKLAASGGVSREELERARTSAMTLRQEREAVRARVEGARSELAAARTTLDVRGAGRTSAVVVRAPIAGVLIRLAEEHERVVPAGALIAQVGDPSTVEVVLPLLTTDAIRVRKGAEMRVTTGPASDTLAATVSLVEPSAFTRLSPLGVQEQRVNVIGLFATPPVGLGDAFRVDARVTLDEIADAVIVPTSALVREGAGWSVFVVAEGRARHRAVTLGRRAADAAAVTNGLAAGERVVTYPSELVTDGVRVKTVP